MHSLQRSAAKGRKRAPMPEPVTEGQRLLQVACERLTYDRARDAMECAPTQTMIMHWLRGERRPGNEMRARLWAAFQIPVDSWNHPPSASNGMAKSGEYTLRPNIPAEANGGTNGHAILPVVNGGGTRPSTLDQCLSVLDTLRAARAVPNLIASEQIKLADAEGRMLALRMRLERDAERTEDRIVREHPEWHRLKRLIVKTLSAHPAALKDLSAALDEALESEDPT